MSYHSNLMRVAAFALAACLPVSAASAETLRVATYNMNLDTTFGASHPDQQTDMLLVLRAIGSAKISDNGVLHAQPIDVLAIQELPLNVASGTTQLQTIVNALNVVYGAGTYSFNNTVDPTSGGTGGGRSALIYNTKTVQVTAAAPIGSVSSAGAARAPMQYTLQIAGSTSADTRFYMDVSHMKSNASAGTTPNATRRNTEAQAITANTAALGPNAHVIALGDFNIAGSTEQTYQTLRAQFHDPANPLGTWTDNNNTNRRLIPSLLSENTTGAQYRDDIQFVTPAADHNSGVPGLQYDLGSITVFGNGGSTSIVGNAVNSSSNPNPFFNNPEFATLYPNLTTDLMNTSDHLPVVADYDIVLPSSVPEPATIALLAIGGVTLLRRRA